MVETFSRRDSFSSGLPLYLVPRTLAEKMRRAKSLDSSGILSAPALPEPELIRLTRFKVTPAAKGVLLKMSDASDRSAAEKLAGSLIVIRREDLPETEEDEFYHADLLDLTAWTVSGRPLGVVESLLEGGSAVVLVIKDNDGKETLVPFTEEFVPEVDLKNSRLTVAEIPGLLD
jgi:16S rRNA processing protein RimM